MNKIFEDIYNRIVKSFINFGTLNKVQTVRKLFATGNIREIEKYISEIDGAFIKNISGIFNNSVYSPKSEITNLSSAIVILGKHKIMETIVLHIIIKDLLVEFNPELKSQFFHNITVGLIAESIYPSVTKKTDEKFEIFLSGFYHNFGKMVLLGFDKGIYFDIMEEAKAEQLNYYEVEKILYGHSFQIKFVVAILKYFEYQEIILHTVENYRTINNSPYKIEASVIQISDIFATGLNIGEIEEYKLPELDKEVLNYIKFTPELINSMFKSFISRLPDIPKFYKKFIEFV
ncbi:HDOD domain-containing protein [Candidatus Dependentiae bacterium]|nr:HDOD domain-containing protein [Candidatus Dependentiae bacterium]